jgi:eukaryotic-like serine/threonine-protein kinase
MIGTRLAHYEITSHLGTGGMGEVYQALDTKLGRNVAVKLLPPSLSGDAERLSRFRREAQMLAALNHPNIAQVYGIEESGETRCIVMELVDGETLQTRLEKGPIPADEALAIAKQIAEALETAHEKGIIHRDLKPGNVMLTVDGKVKVLDFGLAKAAESSVPDAGVSNSPTMVSMSPTKDGMILGTAAYVSPEQAKGRTLDTRTDVWAFGVVLYEMLTGSSAFPGETIIEILGAVLKAEPDWSRLPEGTPPAIIKLIRRCLRKDRHQRLHDVADARIEIADAINEPHHGIASAHPRVNLKLRIALIAASAAIAGAVLAAMLVRTLRPPSAAPLNRLSIMTPEASPLRFTGTPSLALAISPDGNMLVYVGENPEVRPSRAQLYIRSLNDLKVRPIPGTDGAVQPFFSPDGKWVAFFTFTDELKKVSLSGGSPVTLSDKVRASRWASGVWVDSDTIVISNRGAGLQRISPNGGPAEQVTSLERTQGERYHSNAELLPGTRTVLFDVSYENLRATRVEAVMVDSGERRVVLENASEPHYLNSGHLLFKRDDVLLVVPFDSKKLTVLGSEVPVVDKILQQVRAQLVVAPGGTMAYIPESEDALRTLGSVGTDGVFQTFPGVSPNNFSRPSLSPDGQFVAFEVTEGLVSKIQVYDVKRGTTAKLTQEGSDSIIAWHPNSREIAVHSERQNASGIFLKDLNGRERLLVKREIGTIFRPGSWSPDGKELAYVVQSGRTHDIWIVAEDGKSAPRAYLNTPASEYLPKFSPDGKWLAYVSEKSGRPEVYVKPYPEGDDSPVSAGGGNGPLWRSDGKEIFFQTDSDPARPLMAVSVTTEGKGLKLGNPVKVLDVRSLAASGQIESFSFSGGWPGNNYDIFPDGKRFVTVRGADTRKREIVVVQNWFREFEAR